MGMSVCHCVWHLQGRPPLPEARDPDAVARFSLQPSRVLRRAELPSRPGPEDLFPLVRREEDASEYPLLVS